MTTIYKKEDIGLKEVLDTLNLRDGVRDYCMKNLDDITDIIWKMSNESVHIRGDANYLRQLYAETCIEGLVDTYSDDHDAFIAALHNCKWFYTDAIEVYMRTHMSWPEYFSCFFKLISKEEAKKMMDADDRRFLILMSDYSDRYAEDLSSWEEIEETFPGALFGIED